MYTAQCRTVVGRGRCFLRVALCQKLITIPIEHLVKNKRHTQYWYSADSIIGDQSLRGNSKHARAVLYKLDFTLSWAWPPSITDADPL